MGWGRRPHISEGLLGYGRTKNRQTQDWQCLARHECGASVCQDGGSRDADLPSEAATAGSALAPRRSFAQGTLSARAAQCSGDSASGFPTSVCDNTTQLFQHFQKFNTKVHLVFTPFGSLLITTASAPSCTILVWALEQPLNSTSEYNMVMDALVLIEMVGETI